MRPTLMDEKLIRLVKQAVCGDQHEDGLSLDAAYRAFCRKVAKMTTHECSATTMRAFDLALIELEDLKRELELSNHGNHATRLYCHKALKVLHCELHILTVSLEHPGFAEQTSGAVISPLYFNDKEFSPTDLVELITPLFELGVLLTRAGAPARLKTIIRVFEKAFNISIPNYAVLRCAAINRKINLTRFLDKMRDVLIKLSQQ